MKITYDSHKLMSFFVENNCLIPMKQTKTTDNFFSHFFTEIINAAAFIDEQKRISKQNKQPFKQTTIQLINQSKYQTFKHNNLSINCSSINSILSPITSSILK